MEHIHILTHTNTQGTVKVVVSIALLFQEISAREGNISNSYIVYPWNFSKIHQLNKNM